MTSDATTSAVDAATTIDPTAATESTAILTTSVETVQAGAHHAPTLAEIFNGIGVNVVYLMGFSFILGSLFTVLILVLLDYMRRHKN